MTDCTHSAKQLLKFELSKRGISHAALALLLQKQGIRETKSSIDSKVSRGTFSADFFLHCLTVIGCKRIDMDDSSALSIAENTAVYSACQNEAKTLKFIDLFAGMGGTRIGFEQACKAIGMSAECVFSSEIKQYAVELYKHNFNGAPVQGDITQIDETQLPDFDYLLGGFPCQAFSTAGKKMGFNDTRGTLFFDIARILKHKQPQGFLLENVEGLVTHDKKHSSDKIGHTLKTVLSVLEELGYQVTWKVLDAKEFGIPQERKRIYIRHYRKIRIYLSINFIYT